MATDRRTATAPMLVRDGALALPNVPHVTMLGDRRLVLWDTARRRAIRLEHDSVRALVSILADGTDKQKEDATAVIANAACDQENRQAIGKIGALPLLVQMIRDSAGKGRLGLSMTTKSIRAIANLTWQNANNQLMIEKCKGVDLLVDILARERHSGVDEELQSEAAAALNHIVDHEAIASRIDANAAGDRLNQLAQDGSESERAQATWLLAKIACHTMKDSSETPQVDFTALVDMLTSESISHSVRAAAVLRRLSKDSENKSKIMVAGGVGPLIGLLSRGSEKEKVDAAWTLGQLAWNAFSESQIANAGAFPPLLLLLHSDSVREREAAVWALRHLSGTTENRKSIGSTPHAIHSIVNCVRVADTSCERQHATATLKNLACQSENQSAIAASGAIPVLLTVVQKGGRGEAIEALATLRNLVRLNTATQAQLVAAGGISHLVRVVLSGCDSQRVHAVAALANIAANKETQFELVADGALSSVLPLTDSDNVLVLEQVLLLIRNLVWTNDSIQQRIGASGVIPRIVATLKLDVESYHGVQKQAAAALRNLAWRCPSNQARIEEAHGVVHLLRLLGGGGGTTTSSEREHAAGALANLLWNNDRIQEAVAATKGLAVLTEWATRGSDKVRSQAKLALRQFVFGEDKRVHRAAAGVVPSLIRLLQSSSQSSSHQQATWMVANLACHPDNKGDIVSAGAVPPLVTLLSKGTDRQKQYAASALANLASSHAHKLEIIAAGAMPPLVKLLSYGTDGQKKHAAWAVRNVAWSCSEGQAAVAAAGGIAPLISLLVVGTDQQKEHAAAALGNLACDENNQLSISAAGGTEALVSLLYRGSDSQKQQAVWALANLALAASNRAQMKADARAVAALEHVLEHGTPQQQRGAASALARLQDPGRLVHPVSNDGPSAVFRAVSEGSEDTLHLPPPPQHAELARGGSLQSRVSTYQSAGEQPVAGRALYRSIKSVPAIITRSPTASLDSASSPPTRSPTEYQHHSHRSLQLDGKLHAVQEASDLAEEAYRVVYYGERSNRQKDSEAKVQLRRVQSSAPLKRVAYRMPPSPVEHSRVNRPLLPRPSTLGDLLDPVGGLTPPSDPSKLLRSIKHQRNTAAAASARDADKLASSGYSKPRHDQRRSPPVDLKRSVNEPEHGHYDRAFIPGKENLPAQGSVLEELFRRSVGVATTETATPRPQWNGHDRLRREGSERSSFEEVYAYDENELTPPRSKYPPVMTL